MSLTQGLKELEAHFFMVLVFGFVNMGIVKKGENFG